MINPNIALQAKAPNLQSSFRLFNDSLNSVQNRQMNAQSMQQGQQLFDAQMSANKRMLSKERENELIRSVAEYAPILEQQITNGDYLGAVKGLQKRKETLESRGIDTTETDEAIQTILNGNPEDILPDLQIAKTEAMNRGLLSTSLKTAGERDRESLFSGFTDAERAEARRIEAGLSPRAGTVSSVERIAGDERSTERVAGSRAKIESTVEGAKETAKLSAQLNLQPEVDSAVRKATLAAQEQSAKSASDRSNKRALNVYATGIRGLTEAMENAYTGPIAGLMPALTQDSRVADGAIAAMAPVLKSMFRSSGEGTFTDKDQELLIAMIPTRRDGPEARAAKLKNIDAIVRAKLAPMGEEPDAPQPQGVDINNLSDQDIDNLSLEELQRLSEQL